MEEAEACKARGNQHFINNENAAALAEYTKAIQLSGSSNATYYNNRAAVYLRLEEYQKALEDADAALRLDSSLTKARFRKATALFKLGQAELSLQEMHTVKRQAPNDASVDEFMKQVKELVRELRAKKPNLQSTFMGAKWYDVYGKDRKADAYKWFVDSYRMFCEDTYVLRQWNIGIYTGEEGEGYREFKRYLRAAHQAPDMLPSWFDDEECKAVAKELVQYAVEKSDIQDEYHDPTAPLAMRAFTDELLVHGYQQKLYGRQRR